MDIAGLFKDYTTTSVLEATPDFLEIPHHKPANSKTQHSEQHTDGSGVERRDGVRRYSEAKTRFLIELFPLQLKTFVVTLQ